METTEREAEAVSPVIGVVLMVAITVILAAVIGTFVLGLGAGVSNTANAAVTVEESPGRVTFTITDPGNADSAIMVGPNGNRSAKATDTLQAGAKVIIQDGGFNKTEVINVSKTNRKLIAKKLGISVSKVPKNLVGDDECLIRHGARVVRELPLGGADIGCSAQILNDFIKQTLGTGGFAGGEIDYKTGAEYKLVGVVDGSQNVMQTYKTTEE